MPFGPQSTEENIQEIQIIRTYTQDNVMAVADTWGQILWVFGEWWGRPMSKSQVDSGDPVIKLIFLLLIGNYSTNGYAPEFNVEKTTGW